MATDNVKVARSELEQAKQELEALKRQNEALRRNQREATIPPVRMQNFMQEFTKDQKSLFVRDLKSKLLAVFQVNDPKSRLQKRSQFETTLGALVNESETWLQQKARHKWRVKDCTPVFKLEKETKTDLSYIDFTFTSPGLVGNVQHLNSVGVPVPEPEPVFLKVRVNKLEVI